MHFRHFLRDQSKGNRLCSIVLLVIAKAYRLKLIDRFAGCVHGLNVMFVSARRDIGSTKSAVALYRNEIWIGANLRLNIRINAADVAAVADVLGTDADGNHVVGRSHAIAGSSAQGCVETSTGVSRECKDAAGCVAVTGSIGKKRPVTICRVVLAIGIIMESLNSGCCIDITDGVANERVHARSGVTKAGSIVVERERAGNRVVVTSGVVEECLKTTRRVEVAGGIASEHTITDGRIGFASSVELKFKLSPEDQCTTESCWGSR